MDADVPNTMLAWRVTRFGGVEALRQESVPVPEPGRGEVLIEVQAAALNPVDLKTLQGRYPLISQDDLPFTLGRDVAGVVVRRGEGAQAWPLGARVCAFVGQGQGALADYVVAPATVLAGAPAKCAVDAAGAIPLAALTAWQGLFDHGKLQSGERVLIQGASGGVGRFAVQFARHCGARVVATASAGERASLMALGATEVIDYHAQRFEDATGEVDLVFDLVGGATQERSWQVVKNGGALVSTLSEPSQAEAARHGARATRYTARPDGAQLAHIVDLVEKGAVKVEVVERFDFDDAPRGFERLAASHLHGKLVVMREWHDAL
ncbi:NADP-dependent oxidoreductase [Paraburkholderia lycopersici]|uniref:NADPH:quinone reductase n=1 Tax=Paraburkholderia lycopersici TaxID=416944 RepID=A0A1G6H712_9BURK|nr:NADP-dependent oxidoreductase [Paraburkholderia lycopersici]SDB90042.1 NADPH:quinone reductase [Paraburkholderia lycopersici]